MYRPAARATSRSTEVCEYVCYQCRHRSTGWRRARVLSATQVREESTQTIVAQPGEVDDWMNNFNSLTTDEEKSTRPTKEHNARKSRATRTENGSRQHGSTIRKSARPVRTMQQSAKPQTISELYTKLMSGSGANENSPETLPDVKAGGGQPQAQRHAHGSESRLDVPLNISNSAFRRSDVQVQAQTRAQQKRIRKKEARLQQAEPTQSEAVSLEHKEATGEPVADEAVLGAAARQRERFEQLLAELRLSARPGVRSAMVAEEATQAKQETTVSDVGLPDQLTNTSEPTGTAAAKRIERPDFPFPAAMVRVGSPNTLVTGAGAVDSIGLEHQAQLNSVSGGRAREATAASVPTAPPREYSFAKRTNPFSIAAKVKEAQNRPMWGGVPQPPPPAKSPKISFDSLAAADAVSIKAKAKTAGERTAWGGEPVKSTHAKVEQTTGQDDAALGDPLMDREFAEKHAIVSKEQSSADDAHASSEEQSPSGVLKAVMNSMDSLREKLGVRLFTDPAPTPHAVSSIIDETIVPTETVSDDAPETVVAPHGDGTKSARKANLVRNLATNGKLGDSYHNRLAEQKARRDRTRASGDAGSEAAIAESGNAESLDLDTGVATPYNDDSSSRLAELHKVSSGVDGRDTQIAEKPSRTSESLAERPATKSGGRKKSSGAPARERVRERQLRASAAKSETLSSGSPAVSAAESGASNGANDGPDDGADDHISMQAAMSSLHDSVDISAEPSEDVTIPEPELYEQSDDGSNSIGSMSAADLEVTALNIEQPPVPPVQYGLDRVLFNPGVYQLQDPQSRVYNFDPYLREIMPIQEFDFNALKEYKTSSQDVMLAQLANEHGKKYVGSTSSMTSTLAHFHYLLSNWRQLNLGMLSKGFKEEADGFTLINRAPNAIFLRYKEASGTYAIDADKEYDSPNVLMMLGKSMEKLLTAPKEEYERYRIGNTTNPITPAEKDAPEAFEYTTMGDFLMRSQLDAHDPRLPGTGMFDLKTRACLSVRMDAENYKEMLGYEILTLQGRYESYEREYYDMMRSTMLKYMLQARMGRMDGIFVAYHNVERIFGFQYLPISDIDRAIHGQIDPCLGDQEFRFSLKLMNEALEAATNQFPGKSLRIHFECVEKPQKLMWIFAEPMEESEIKEIQGKGKEKIAAFEAEIMGLEREKEAPQVDVVAATVVDKTEAQATKTTAEEADASTTTAAVPEQMKPPQDNVDYTSTTTPADPKFYTKITPPSEENLRPLFAATLIVQNLLDGQPCDNNRPSNLKRDQNWEVQYIFKEADIPLASKWARYEDCKTRRRLTFAKGQEKDDDVAGEGAEPKRDKRETGYFKMLREMVERGRKFRKLVNKAESGKEKVVVGQEVGVESSGKVDVTGYMNWLYSKK
ncbi:hypothetical protein LTR86_002881 [Recurvomyces mirabilis]|nr:hypothetical protein LTR86_002881 [Recurvomyces mirabilis]